jgi:hypothetical protein
MFLDAVQSHNNKRKIGLVRASETRMGGYLICWLRIFRLRAPLEQVVVLAKFKNLPRAQRPPDWLVKLVKDDTFWDRTHLMLRALYGPFRVLRLCDSKVPVMDKLMYFGRRTTSDLSNHMVEMNAWKLPPIMVEANNAITTKKQQEISKKAGKIGGTANFENEDDEEESGKESGDEADEDGEYNALEDEEETEEAEEEIDEDEEGFGTVLCKLWKKRNESLVHGYSVAGWLLSPCKVIQEDVKKNIKNWHKDMVNELLEKLYVAPKNEPREVKIIFRNKLLNTFWTEWNDFNSRTGIFEASKFFWMSDDIDKNLSHLWHKKNSLVETDWLGKFACRVCSKIAGIGNAERNWGDVKHLKTGQRSHLSSDMISKCATIYGAACAEKANRKTHGDDVFTMWEDVDMDHLGLDKFGLTKDTFRIDPNEVRMFNCFMEDWEEECIETDDLANKLKLLKKYAGLKFDEDGVFRIDKDKMNFMNKGGNRGFKALACRPTYDKHDPDENDYDNMIINADLHGLIYSYYKDKPDPKIRIVTKPEHIDPVTKEWMNWIPEPEKTGTSRAAKKNNAPKRAPASRPQLPTQRDHGGSSNRRGGRSKK